MKYLYTLLLAIVLWSCHDSSEKASLQSKIASLTAEKDSLVQLNHQLANKIDSINQEAGFWFDNSHEASELERMGIQNPKEWLTNALMKRTELIPVEPVLGGQMKFMKVQPMGCNYLIAYFEDGHTNGQAIYTYSFNNGKIDFKLISSCKE